jgi:protein CMS1
VSGWNFLCYGYTRGTGEFATKADKLLTGALSVAKVEVIIIDASHVNAKKRGILDMPETQIPLIKLLAREEFKARYGIEERGLKVAMY